VFCIYCKWKCDAHVADVYILSCYAFQKDIEKNTQDYIKRFANPIVAAQRGFIDDIIEPEMTRSIICRDLELLRTKKVPTIQRRNSNIPL